jgi:hypothetical protein
MTPTVTIDPNCNRVAFVADITVPDGTSINATERFTKTWRFVNVGTCTWVTSYRFTFISGDQMGAPDSIELPKIVTPGENVDISIDLTAPDSPGVYKGIWSFEDTGGRQFGLGPASTGEIWVQVRVVAEPTSTPTASLEPTGTSTPTAVPPTPPFGSDVETLAYDFIAQACSAEWRSNDVTVPCPGSDPEAQNRITIPALENGTTPGYPAVRVNPGAVNGSVSGSYPEFVILPGDHLRALASCEADAPSCSALFRISYLDDSGQAADLWAVGEFYDREYTEVDIDLSPLAGKAVRLTLSVTSLSADSEHGLLWVSPGIYRRPQPTATVTPQPTPTATGTPTPTPAPPPTAAPEPPAAEEPRNALEAIWEFFSDLFRRLFGG